MDQRLEETLINIWRQAMVEDVRAVELDGRRYGVQQTSRHRLRQVDFSFDGKDMRGLEQNPETGSRWAQMAREGKKVMQFLSGGKYLAVVVDGKVITYGERG